MIYSHSRLATYESCMRKGYYQYKEGRPTPSGLPAQVGKIFHTSMSFVINEGYEPSTATYASIYEANGLPEGETTQNLISMVDRGYKRVLKLQSENVEVLSETHVIVEIAPGIKVQGYIDLIVDDPSEDSVLLGDFKTSWVPYEATRTHQLRLYALMYMLYKSYMPNVFKGRLIFPRLSPEYDSEVIFTKEMIDETRKWVINLVKRINEAGEDIDNYPMATDKRTCDLCPFVGLCASKLGNNIPLVPADHIEAELIGAYILLQEQNIKIVKEELKKYVKATESVETMKGTWEFKQGEPNPKIDILDLVYYADEKSIDFTSLVNVDTKKLKDLLAEDTTGELKKLVKYTSPRSSFVFTPSNEDNDIYEDV